MADENEQVETEEQDAEVSESEARDGAIEDAGEKTYSQEQFSGLLNAKQEETAARQNAQAEAATLRENNEQLQRQLEEANKPKETELSEEEAGEMVTMGELHNFGKKLADNLTSAIKTQQDADKEATLKQKRSQNAQDLAKTHTVKAMGEGLDAQTVINEGVGYLQANHPTLYRAALASPNCASELYKLCTTFVPEIIKRAAAKKNAILANKLDQSGNPSLPSGSAPTSEGTDFLESLIDGSISEADVENMVLEEQK
jgi:hypothetical protein